MSLPWELWPDAPAGLGIRSFHPLSEHHGEARTSRVLNIRDSLGEVCLLKAGNHFRECLHDLTPRVSYEHSDTWYKVVHVGMPARMVPGHPWPTSKCFGLILSIRYWAPSYADSYLGLVLAPSRLGGVLWTKVAFILGEVADRASVSR